MFGNTFVLPHADGNITAVKINQDKYSSEYLAKASLYEMSVRIRHSKTKAKDGTTVMDRHNVEIIRTTYATAELPQKSSKTYIVLEREPSDNDVKDIDALADWLIATANSNILSLLNWES